MEHKKISKIPYYTDFGSQESNTRYITQMWDEQVSTVMNEIERKTTNKVSNGQFIVAGLGLLAILKFIF